MFTSLPSDHGPIDLIARHLPANFHVTSSITTSLRGLKQVHPVPAGSASEIDAPQRLCNLSSELLERSLSTEWVPAINLTQADDELLKLPLTKHDTVVRPRYPSAKIISNLYRSLKQSARRSSHNCKTS